MMVPCTDRETHLSP